jgi:fatty-acyl-CoA synthase
MLEAHYGVPGAGGILVAINTRLSSDEIGYILGHSGASFLFVDAELAELIKPLDLPGVRVVRVDDTGTPGDPYEDFLAQGAPAPVPSWLEDEEETIAINYTSGTTGRPKGVMYSARGAYMNAIGELIESGMNFETRYLWTLPMFHCNGWCFTWAVTAVGGTHICLRRVESGRIWDLLESEAGDPLQRRAHGADRRRQRPEGEEARALGDGDGGGRAALADAPGQAQGAEFPARPRLRPHRDVWPAHGVRVALGVGRAAAEEQARLAARQGQGYAVFDLVRVVDNDMNDVPRDGDTLGEVVMRGNNVAKGYYEQPEATAESFRGGWFHSGDIGVWHPDGYIELRDRKKDIIISGGENISTIEVEQAVAKHPAVLECAVVAIPDEKWGERPKAFVMLKAGASATEADIIEFCRQHIARFKCPAAVEFGELPKTSTGKIQKFVLRDKEWGGRSKKIN